MLMLCYRSLIRLGLGWAGFRIISKRENGGSSFFSLTQVLIVEKRV